MMLSWMGYAALCAALCAVIGACADSAVRRRRRIVWLITMSASIVLPVVLPLLAAPGSTASSTAVIEHSNENTASIATVPPTLPASGSNWNRIAIVAWMTSSTLIACLLLRSNQRLVRRLRAYRRTNIDGQALLVSDNFGPAIVGFLHPVIVLPAWILSLDENERRLVVLHEMQHQQAGDPAVAIAALCAVVLLPWNAALWWQLARLRLAIELDCDARVVAQSGADPIAYGQLLVTAHEHSGYARGPALALAPLRSTLGKRINALVSRTAQSRHRTVSATGVALLALSAMAMAPVPDLPRDVGIRVLRNIRRDGISSTLIVGLKSVRFDFLPSEQRVGQRNKFASDTNSLAITDAARAGEVARAMRVATPAPNTANNSAGETSAGSSSNARGIRLTTLRNTVLNGLSDSSQMLRALPIHEAPALGTVATDNAAHQSSASNDSTKYSALTVVQAGPVADGVNAGATRRTSDAHRDDSVYAGSRNQRQPNAGAAGGQMIFARALDANSNADVLDQRQQGAFTGGRGGAGPMPSGSAGNRMPGTGIVAAATAAARITPQSRGVAERAQPERAIDRNGFMGAQLLITPDSVRPPLR